MLMENTDFPPPLDYYTRESLLYLVIPCTLSKFGGLFGFGFFFCVCVLGFFYCGGFLLGFLFVGLFFFYSCLHAYHWAIWGKETPTNLLANIAMPAKNPNAVPRFKPTGIWVYSYDSFCLRKQIKVISTRLPHYCNIAVISGRPSFLLAVASASPCSIRRLRCFKPEISISFMCHAIAL